MDNFDAVKYPGRFGKFNKEWDEFKARATERRRLAVKERNEPETETTGT